MCRLASCQAARGGLLIPLNSISCQSGLGFGPGRKKGSELILVMSSKREKMMQTRLGISAIVLVLSAGVSVQTATACSKEAVAGAADRWATVLAENNPDTIVALYSKDAVLWGTLSSTVRSDPAS